VAQLKDVDSLKVFRFEKRECLLARFPFKGPGSILVGMLKAYPALEEYMNVNKVKPKPVMELYDGVNNQIEYRLVEDLELP
jgi:hypothetical protein